MKVVILALSLLITNTALSEIFKYTDLNGKVHYVSSRSQIPEQFLEQANQKSELPKISKTKQQNWEEKISNDQRYKTKKVSGNLNVFVTPNCSYCYLLEDYLKKNRIKYNRLDISTNQQAQRTFLELGGRGTPLTELNGQVVRGYNINQIQQLLRISN